VLSKATTTMPALWAASIAGFRAVSELASITIASTPDAIMFWTCWICLVVLPVASLTM